MDDRQRQLDLINARMIRTHRRAADLEPVPTPWSMLAAMVATWAGIAVTALGFVLGV
jgi:hypothetical protein